MVISLHGTSGYNPIRKSVSEARETNNVIRFLAYTSGFGYHDNVTSKVDIGRSAGVSERNKEILK
jgi:hypothetical protein